MLEKLCILGVVWMSHGTRHFLFVLSLIIPRVLVASHRTQHATARRRQQDDCYFAVHSTREKLARADSDPMLVMLL